MQGSGRHGKVLGVAREWALQGGRCCWGVGSQRWDVGIAKAYMRHFHKLSNLNETVIFQNPPQMHRQGGLSPLTGP